MAEGTAADDVVDTAVAVVLTGAEDEVVDMISDNRIHPSLQP